MAAYLKKYGGKPDAIDPGSAEAYAVGQLVEEVATKTGKIDNKTIISTLHQGTWPDRRRRPELGPGRLAEGQHAAGRVDRRQAVPVYPPAIALHAPTSPKPAWGG